MVISVHCEDEATIRKNLQEHIDQYGEDIPIRVSILLLEVKTHAIIIFKSY